MNAWRFTARLTAPIYSAVQLERKNKLIWHLRPPTHVNNISPFSQTTTPTPKSPPLFNAFLWLTVFGGTTVKEFPSKAFTFIQKDEALVFDSNLFLNNYYISLTMSSMVTDLLIFTSLKSTKSLIFPLSQYQYICLLATVSLFPAHQLVYDLASE